MPPTTVYSVSQVTAYIKSLFAEDLLLGDVWLSGEVSNFKQATSGHCYFTLKDAASCVRAVIWRTQAAVMALPRDGDAVIAHGYVSVYEPRGDYQFYIDRLEPGGIGWLWQEFQRLKTRLEQEGLFDTARKRPVPALPVRLGVVTSPSAAALRDILRTLTRRYPLVDVILAPTPVQGDQAPAGIVAAIQALNRWSAEREAIDSIIVARGGGSIEELWAFNDERVARAIAASAVPVVTGVGHETDFTIADFVADLRAPTPTGAATMVVPEAGELLAGVAALLASAQTLVDDRLATARDDTAAAGRAPGPPVTGTPDLRRPAAHRRSGKTRRPGAASPDGHLARASAQPPASPGQHASIRRTGTRLRHRDKTRWAAGDFGRPCLDRRPAPSACGRRRIRCHRKRPVTPVGPAPVRARTVTSKKGTI